MWYVVKVWGGGKNERGRGFWWWVYAEIWACFGNISNHKEWRIKLLWWVNILMVIMCAVWAEGLWFFMDNVGGWLMAGVSWFMRLSNNVTFNDLKITVNTNNGHKKYIKYICSIFFSCKLFLHFFHRILLIFRVHFS